MVKKSLRFVHRMFQTILRHPICQEDTEAFFEISQALRSEQVHIYESLMMSWRIRVWFCYLFIYYMLFIYYLFIYLCFCYLCFVSKFILKWGGANKTSIIWFDQLSCSEIITLTFWVLALPIFALTNGYRCKRLSNLYTVANSHYQLIW